MKREGKIKAKREKVGKDDCRRGIVHACQEVYRFLLRRVFVMYIECSFMLSPLRICVDVRQVL